jgi:hypothetical protein
VIFLIIIAVSGNAKHGKDKSKELIAKALKQFGKRVKTENLSTHIGSLAVKFFKWDGNKDEPGRTLLQETGMKIMEKNKYFWVDNVAIPLYALGIDIYDFVLIDVRFPSDIKRLKEIFGESNVITLRVNRVGYKSSLTEKQKSHISETALKNYEFDYVINTREGLDFLRAEVRKFMTNFDIYGS